MVLSFAARRLIFIMALSTIDRVHRYFHRHKTELASDLSRLVGEIIHFSG